MNSKTEKDVTGIELLRQPATLALARYLNDLRSVLALQAFLWTTMLQAELRHGDPTKSPNNGDHPPKESVLSQLEAHSPILDEMVFCRQVNSFLTYLADLLTLIYEKCPNVLSSDKQMTYQFCIEHHLAGDLISALAEKTVTGLTRQGLDSLAQYFKKHLGLVLFAKDAHSTNVGLCVDIRNVMTHNRGIADRFFIRRHPEYANAFGKKVVLAGEKRREMLGDLGYCARQFDVRAVRKFGLETIAPKSDIPPLGERK